jgi:hypothetical protein
MTSFVDRMREAMGWRDEQPTLVIWRRPLAHRPRRRLDPR